MKKFVPLKKQSKTAQREYHSRRRTDWGNVNPAARIEKTGAGTTANVRKPCSGASPRKRTFSL